MGKIVDLDKMGLPIRAKRIYDILDNEKPLVAILLATHFIDSSLEKLLRHNFNKSDITISPSPAAIILKIFSTN